MKLIDIPELKAAIASERTSKIRCLHKLLFDHDGDRQNRNRIREFSGFDFQPNDKDFKEKAKQLEEKFSLNELITISNVLLINNDGTKKEIVQRLLTYLCDLNELNQNIIRESDSEPEPENEIEQHRKSDENLSELSEQLPVHNVYQPNISFSDIESIIMPFNGDSHQSVEKWIELFEDVVNMFNLSDLHKLVFGKRSLKDIFQMHDGSGARTWSGGPIVGDQPDAAMFPQSNNSQTVLVAGLYSLFELDHSNNIFLDKPYLENRPFHLSMSIHSRYLLSRWKQDEYRSRVVFSSFTTEPIFPLMFDIFNDIGCDNTDVNESLLIDRSYDAFFPVSGNKFTVYLIMSLPFFIDSK
ncbi:unnamed protein product [Larinioides sclopetarius]|uniref:SAP domain-containing protein n=1 Tax=Larinioides sclopetarius TaxID=280406 RepID=A0AAV1ZK90_9ARAC